MRGLTSKEALKLSSDRHLDEYKAFSIVNIYEKIPYFLDIISIKMFFRELLGVRALTEGEKNIFTILTDEGGEFLKTSSIDGGKYGEIISKTTYEDTHELVQFLQIKGGLLSKIMCSL